MIVGKGCYIIFECWIELDIRYSRVKNIERSMRLIILYNIRHLYFNVEFSLNLIFDIKNLNVGLSFMLQIRK